MAFKRLKDPIYGYIEIEETLIAQVIDTPSFQRLRDVIQTSYAPLYSSAVHNRFVHSLGVYHLGKIAATAFIGSLSENAREVFPRCADFAKIFELACLLHDVGHAPFSHTGEKFYLEKGSRSELHDKLVALTGDTLLAAEIKDNSYKAAPHELMSAIIALQVYGIIIPSEMNSFFARCITGYKYTSELDTDKSCLNCFIELLNSKIIDVDKLDYLLRDSYMAGFDTTAIDYERLLKSICAVPNNRGHYRICYNKAAVSVIENVVYAHDAERKWIQNHPIVLYDAYLIENIIAQVMKNMLKSEKLAYELLSEQGVQVESHGQVRLMGDSDLRYLMKNLESSREAEEYYNRNLRKHPLWKTEAEFQAIFLNREDELKIIEDEFENLRTHLRSLGLPFELNNEALKTSQEEVLSLEERAQGMLGLEKEKMNATLSEKKMHIKWMQIFETFSAKEHISFDFLVIYADQFNSGFRKQEFGNIEFVFPELKVPCRFEDVSNVLTSPKSKGEKFFFLYYSRDTKKKVKISELVKDMLQLASTIHLENRLL